MAGSSFGTVSRQMQQILADAVRPRIRCGCCPAVAASMASVTLLEREETRRARSEALRRRACPVCGCDGGFGGYGRRQYVHTCKAICIGTSYVPESDAMLLHCRPAQSSAGAAHIQPPW